MIKPDRYFMAFVEIKMPWCTHKAWEPAVKEVILFAQPDMPAYCEIVSTVKRICPSATNVVLENLHEIGYIDFVKFMNGSSDWEVGA